MGKERSLLESYALYGACGVALAASVVAGLVFGNYLDKKMETWPWLTLTGVSAGFVGGMYNLFKILKKMR